MVFVAPGPAHVQPPPPLVRSRWPLLLAGALVLAGVAASLWLWQASAGFLARDADDEFDRFSELSFNNIGQRVQHQLDLLAGFQALFRASSEVSRAEFHGFYNDQRVQVRFPGLLAVQYARLIDGSQREALEAEVRADRSIDPAGYPDFRIHPPGRRDQHLVVTYNEPMRGNEPAFGHDNIANPARREEAERARDSGQPQASAPLMLLQQRTGVLVRLPLYRRNAPTDTVAQRRQAYAGQLSGVLLVEDLLRDTLPSRGDAPYQVKVSDHGLLDIAANEALRPAVRVTQSSTDGAQALWAADAAPPRDADLRQHSLAMAGRQWTIQVARPHVDHARAPFPLMLLAGGLSITLLLALLVARLSWLQHRAQRLARAMSEQALAHADRLQAVFNSTVDGILTMDQHGTVLSANRAALAIFGHAEPQLLGHSLARLMPDASSARIGDWLAATPAPVNAAGEIADTAATLPARPQTLQARRADGSLFPVELSLRAMAADGQRQVVAVVRDLSETQATQARIAATAQALRAADELREAVFRHAAFALIVTDALGVLQALNPAAERLLGCRAADEVGRHKLGSFMDLSDRSMLQSLLRQQRAAARSNSSNSSNSSNNGSPRPQPDAGPGRGIERTVHLLQRSGGRVASSITVSALHDNQGQVSGFLAIACDVTERQRLAEQLSQLAYHDGLTGLPNRLRLEDRLQQAIAQASRRHEPLDLLFIDLDRFKPINDSHGHAVGDQVLCEVARRLQTQLRASDLVARLGGDEFVVLLTTLATHEDCLAVADKLMLALAEPMQIGALTLQVGASMGVARYPEMGNTAAELLRSADAAMYQAKQAGRSALPLRPLLLARPGDHTDAAPQS